MLQTICIIVKGKVQGVYYRQHIREKSKELQITGTVKNLPGGSVEIIATGETDQINTLIAWCKKGPPRAQVTEITTTPLSLQLFSNFSIIR